MAFCLSRNRLSKISNRLINILAISSSSLVLSPSSGNISTLGEYDVIDQLSHLLPIRIPKAVVEPCPEQEEKKKVASYLTPVERLRGVFFQKLKSRSFAEGALLNAQVDLSLDIVSGVLNGGNMGGDAMLIFFSWALKQPGIQDDARSYNTLLRALGNRRYVTFIEKVLQDMKCKGVKINLESWEIVIEGLVSGHRVTKAIETFEKCHELGLERCVESLNVLLKCLCESYHVRAANSYFKSVKKRFSYDAMSYTIIIGGWANIGQTAKIESLLKEMAEDGFQPDCLTYAHLLEGLWKAGKVEEAENLFEGMKESCLPNISIYNTMIRNSISDGNLDVAISYFDRLSAAQCVPDSDAYEYLIIALIKAQKVADALAMFNDMMNLGIFLSAKAVSRCVKLACSSGPPFAAMKIYTRTRKAGIRISISAYKSLLLRLSILGKCGMMLKVWTQMAEDGYSDDVKTYEYIINGLCNVGHLEAAVSMMETAMKKDFCPNKIVYGKLNNKLLKTNSVDTAYRLFLKVKEARCQDSARKYWRANGWHF